MEETAMVLMQEAETAGKESAELSTSLNAEKTKLVQLKEQIGESIKKLELEIQQLKVPRDALSATLPPKARAAFEKPGGSS